MSNKDPFNNTNPKQPIPLRIGTTTVIIQKLLAEGGFARVYEAVKADDNSKVAVKRIIAQSSQVKDVEYEIELMRVFKHKNIVTFVDSDERYEGGDSTEFLICMELCTGGQLIDVMNRRSKFRFKEPEILQIFSDICEAVAFLHYMDPPVTHRDIKVENVLISSMRVFKLCDFGSCTTKTFPHGYVYSPAEMSAVQEEIDQRTTLQYRAPEMCDLYRRLGLNEKTDIWALGIMLYKLCFYTTPFENDGKMAILNNRYEIPTTPSYSDELHGLIRRMLTPDPQYRPNIYQVVETVFKLRNVPCPISNIYSDTPAGIAPPPSSQNSKTRQIPNSVQPAQQQQIQQPQPQFTPQQSQISFGKPANLSSTLSRSAANNVPPPALLQPNKPPSPSTFQQQESSSNNANNQRRGRAGNTLQKGATLNNAQQINSAVDFFSTPAAPVDSSAFGNTNSLGDVFQQSHQQSNNAAFPTVENDPFVAPSNQQPFGFTNNRSSFPVTAAPGQFFPQSSQDPFAAAPPVQPPPLHQQQNQLQNQYQTPFQQQQNFQMQKQPSQYQQQPPPQMFNQAPAFPPQPTSQQPVQSFQSGQSQAFPMANAANNSNPFSGQGMTPATMRRISSNNTSANQNNPFIAANNLGGNNGVISKSPSYVAQSQIPHSFSASSVSSGQSIQSGTVSRSNRPSISQDHPYAAPFPQQQQQQHQQQPQMVNGGAMSTMKRLSIGNPDGLSQMGGMQNQPQQQPNGWPQQQQQFQPQQMINNNMRYQ